MTDRYTHLTDSLILQFALKHVITSTTLQAPLFSSYLYLGGPAHLRRSNAYVGSLATLSTFFHAFHGGHVIQNLGHVTASSVSVLVDRMWALADLPPV